MSWALAACGWLLAAGVWRSLRRRCELSADAEHELRGPATALTLACEHMRRHGGNEHYAELFDAQLARLRMGLDDLAAARRGRRARERPVAQELRPLAIAAARGVQRPVEAEWDAGIPRVVADRGRLAQALGNLLANAAEHGDGPVELRGRRVPGAVRVEVRNRAAERRPQRADGRGRGLRIAGAAAASAGGRLELTSDRDQVVAALELPAEEPPLAGAA